MLLQVNSTLFFQIINFLVLIWILNKLLFRPFLDLVERRKEETEGTRKKAADIMDHAEYLKGSYNANIAEATSAAAAMNEVQRKQGRGESERILDEARTGSSGYLTSSRRELQAGLDEVRKQIAGLSADLAGEMARKILGRNTR
jgi:F-type H+-transporting ATPase subunit b